MVRRDFVEKMTRIGLAVALAGITALVGKKIVVRKDCSGCPDYASCPGKESCEIIASN